jgi:hypothetical protein
MTTPDASDQPIVTRLGNVGVFVRSGWNDPNGQEVAGILKAIEGIRDLEELGKLSGPKFEAAMQDEANRTKVKDAIKKFCRCVHYVGVVSVKSE